MTNISRFWQRRGDRRNPLLPALLLGLAASLPVSAETYELIDLGADVSPADISNLGTIVGSRKTDAGSIAFRWRSRKLEDLDGTTIANAVNEANQVAGNTLTGAFLFDDGLTEWDGYGGYGINEDGRISGNKQLNNPYRPTPLPLDPAIYTPPKWVNLDVATVYPRGTRQGVYADLYVLDDINDSGFAVGSRRRYGLVGSSSILTTDTFDAVIYLPIPYGGYAKAINNQNMIVGATGGSSATGEYSHAYLYDYDKDELLDLSTLNDGLGLTSSAADINESNQVVGTSWLVTQLTSLYDPTQYHAFLWQDGVMTDLNDLPIVAGSGWILTAATAINDNGDIVGTGLLDGQVRGFLLSTGQVPPASTNASPIAVASADPTSGKAPLIVSFSSADSYDPDGTIVSYAWDFGDGSEAVSPYPHYPQHEYTKPGTYIAVLTVMDDQGLSATAVVEIKVRKSRRR